MMQVHIRLPERLEPGSFRARDEVAVTGTLTEGMGTNEVSWRWWVRHLQDARDVSSWRNMGFPTESDL